ncbi:hypothetical protein QFZ76_000535 [Streptomyces sp. V4I2]|nr:hypothetical protein [Streptomyces sp. V4I2]
MGQGDQGPLDGGMAADDLVQADELKDPQHRRQGACSSRQAVAPERALSATAVLAHLRNGQPYAQLAASFGIGTTTVCR